LKKKTVTERKGRTERSSLAMQMTSKLYWRWGFPANQTH